MTFKPMLAETCEDMRKVRFPVLASPKLDGVRCLIRGGQAVARSLKPIPNVHVQKMLAGLPEGLDGELICGRPTAPQVFTRTQSAVMSKSTVPDLVMFHIFDMVADAGYEKRLEMVREELHGEARDGFPVELVRQKRCDFPEELEAFETECVEAGYEGVMIRSLWGPYKFGRSTVKEGHLLKIKRFADDEAVVISTQELMHNGNEAVKDLMGHTDRSTKKDGLIPADTLGSLVVRWRDTTFNIGTGFTADQRKAYWRGRKDLIGKSLTFKFQGVGSDGRPRFPVFKAWRAQEDMSHG